MRRHFSGMASGLALLLFAASTIGVTHVQAYEYQQMFAPPFGGEVRPRAVAPPRELVAYTAAMRLAPLSSRRRNAAFIIFCPATKRSNMASGSAALVSNGVAPKGFR